MLSVTIVLLVALYLGQEVLKFFGISLNSFRVSGGILLMLMSLSMLQGKIRETVRNKEEAKEGEKRGRLRMIRMQLPLVFRIFELFAANPIIFLRFTSEFS